MHFELNVGGLTVVKGELAPVFLDLFRGSTPPPTMPTMSAPMTVPQVRELFASIDAKSVLFLKKLAANGGAMTWGEARAIFGIADTKDWSAYGSYFGRGITRAVRRILQDRQARLVWWHDHDRTWSAADKDPAMLFVDGSALQALREVTQDP